MSIGIPLPDMTMDQFMDLEDKLVGAAGQGLGPGAMRDRVWDLTALAAKKINNNN